MCGATSTSYTLHKQPPSLHVPTRGLQQYAIRTASGLLAARHLCRATNQGLTSHCPRCLHSSSSSNSSMLNRTLGSNCYKLVEAAARPLPCLLLGCGCYG